MTYTLYPGPRAQHLIGPSYLGSRFQTIQFPRWNLFAPALALHSRQQPPLPPPKKTYGHSRGMPDVLFALCTCTRYQLPRAVSPAVNYPAHRSMHVGSLIQSSFRPSPTCRCPGAQPTRRDASVLRTYVLCSKSSCGSVGLRMLPGLGPAWPHKAAYTDTRLRE